MDDSELKFENIYNPIFEKDLKKDSKKDSTSIPIESTDPFCCSYCCNLIFGCFMFIFM